MPALLDAGADRVYATARNPQSVRALDFTADPRVSILALDIDNVASVTAAVQAAPGVTLLVNNAGVLNFGGAADADLGRVEQDLATNYLGTARVTQAILPILESNQPSVIASVLTLISLAPVPGMAGSSASKAAAHSLTQALRAQLLTARV